MNSSPSFFPKKNLVHHLLILALFLLTITLFGQVLKIPLTSDDYIWVRDVSLPHKFTDFLRVTFALHETDFRYRPLMPTTVRLCYQISGSDPFCMHLAGFILHFLNILLVGSLGYLITKNRGAAWAGMFFFAVYFAHVETVAWISDLGNLLAAFFMLVTAILFLRFIVESNYIWWGISLFTFALAMISKESALALGPILLTWGGIMFWKTDETPRRRLIIAAGSSYLLLMGVHLFFINRTGLKVALSGTGNYTYQFNLVTLRNGLNYPLNFIWPTDDKFLEKVYEQFYAIFLASGDSTETIARISAIPELRWIIGGTLIVWITIIFTVWWGKYTGLMVLTWVIWGILPVIFIGSLSDRHLYVTSIGLSLWVGYLFFGRLKNSQGQRVGLKTVALPLIYTVILALNLYWTQIRAQNWQIAGETADKIISTVMIRYPDLSAESELWFAGLPDNFKGAYIFRLGIDAALQLEINNPGLKAYSVPDAKDFPVQLAPHQYAFVFKDNQLIDVTPDYRR